MTIKTIFLKISPAMGANNIILKTDIINSNEIIYNAINNPAQTSRFTINSNNNIINITGNNYTYTLNFTDKDVLKIENTSTAIIPIFNLNNTDTIPIGYRISDPVNYKVNAKEMTTAMSLTGGGIFNATDAQKKTLINGITYYTLSLLKIDLNYNSTNNLNNFRMNLQPAGSTGGSISTAAINSNTIILDLTIDPNGIIAIQSICKDVNDNSYLSTISSLTTSLETCKNNLSSSNDLAIAQKAITLLLNELKFTLNNNPNLTGDTNVWNAFNNLQTNLNILIAGPNASKTLENFNNSVAPLLKQFETILMAAYEKAKANQQKFLEDFQKCESDKTQINQKLSECLLSQSNSTTGLASCNNNLTNCNISLTDCNSVLIPTKDNLTICSKNLFNCNTNLLATRESLTNCNNNLTNCNNNLTIEKNKSTTCDSNLTSCKNDLKIANDKITTCTNSLTIGASNLTACQNNYTTSQNNLTNCNNELTIQKNKLTTSDSNLATCNNNLSSAQSELNKSSKATLNWLIIVQDIINNNNYLKNDSTVSAALQSMKSDMTNGTNTSNLYLAIRNALLTCDTNLTNCNNELTSQKNKLTTSDSNLVTCNDNLSIAQGELSKASKAVFNLKILVSEIVNSRGYLQNNTTVSSALKLMNSDITNTNTSALLKAIRDALPK